MKKRPNIRKVSSREKLIVRSCHICGHVSEGKEEPKKCTRCNKSFLPLNYFHKVHHPTLGQYEALFESSQEIHEDDLIKGLMVLW